MIKDVIFGQLESLDICFYQVHYYKNKYSYFISFILFYIIFFILYYFLFNLGCPPFFGSNSDAIHDMILTEEADFTSKRFAHVSSLALDFLQKVC